MVYFRVCSWCSVLWRTAALVLSIDEEAARKKESRMKETGANEKVGSTKRTTLFRACVKRVWKCSRRKVCSVFASIVSSPVGASHSTSRSLLPSQLVSSDDLGLFMVDDFRVHVQDIRACAKKASPLVCFEFCIVVAVQDNVYQRNGSILMSRSWASRNQSLCDCAAQEDDAEALARRA